jgi:hypothetical protein
LRQQLADKYENESQKYRVQKRKQTKIVWIKIDSFSEFWQRVARKLAPALYSLRI